MDAICKNCQNSFEAKRSTAEFCSTNCRVKYNNKTNITFKVYGLKNPLTNKLFYVGCTRQELPIRLQCHINEISSLRLSLPSKKQEVIKQIMEAGQRPSIELLELTDEKGLKEAEQRWIHNLKLTTGITNFEITGKGPYNTKKEKVIKVSAKKDRLCIVCGKNYKGTKKAKVCSGNCRVQLKRLLDKGLKPAFETLAKTLIDAGAKFIGLDKSVVADTPLKEVPFDEQKQWEESKSAASGPAVKVTINKGAYMNDAIKKKLGL